MNEENNVIKHDNETCPTIGYQAVSVCVPVCVKPFANTGATVTKCCGEPVINRKKDSCCGVKNGTCNFTISQKIIVEIPVVFGAVASVGDTYVDCLCTSAEKLDHENVTALAEKESFSE